jgi:hypothetical protein
MTGAAHRIHLRRAWQREPADSGRVRWRRRFNRPTGLGPREQVWLVLEGFRPPVDVLLNQHPLGSLPPAKSTTRFDVTSLLELRNELCLDTRETEASAGAGTRDQPDPPGEVCLEIRTTTEE